MLGDARRHGGDGAGVIRGAALLQRPAARQNVTPDLAVELIDKAKALLSNELHREWGTTAAKYRARYLISGLKFADGTWKSKARALG
ncbi:methyltransferase domain-containing protein [Aureococcus anophagefferens]|nr:methyltransferase domain-containing protein [Aureococcus anophagefferens]